MCTLSLGLRRLFLELIRELRSPCRSHLDIRRSNSIRQKLNLGFDTIQVRGNPFTRSPECHLFTTQESRQPRTHKSRRQLWKPLAGLMHKNGELSKRVLTRHEPKLQNWFPQYPNSEAPIGTLIEGPAAYRPMRIMIPFTLRAVNEDSWEKRSPSIGRVFAACIPSVKCNHAVTRLYNEQSWKQSSLLQYLAGHGSLNTLYWI